MLVPRRTRAADPLRVGVGSDRSALLVAWGGCSGVAPAAAVDDGAELAGEAADAARYEVDLRKSDGEFVRSASAPPPAAGDPPTRAEAGRAVLLLSGLAAPVVVVVPVDSTGLPTGENADPDSESRLRCREDLPVDDDETAPDRLLDGGVEAL